MAFFHRGESETGVSVMDVTLTAKCKGFLDQLLTLNNEAQHEDKLL